MVALDDEADRVLMGRDISIGGMRVNPSPHLIVGQNIKLAMHLTQGTTPLVVSARVHRSDGERGVLLRFHEVSAEVGRALMGMMEALPVVEPGGENGDTGYVVSELLEVGAR